ncbi:MAG: M28 family peptidase [Candidatus Woesearchaeota archaeon]
MGSLSQTVAELAHRSNYERRLIIKGVLEDYSLPSMEQRFNHNSNSNVLVNFSSTKNEAKLLLCAHYDCFPGSPGANDDASSVSVLLELARKLKSEGFSWPLRIAFFDEEENHLWGSSAYIEEYGINKAATVLNLELVGRGSVPLFWEKKNQSDDYLKLLDRTCGELGRRAYFVSQVLGHGGDHQTFYNSGVNNSICLSMLDERDLILVPEAQNIDSNPRSSRRKRASLIRKIRGSYTLKDYHQKTDTADKISEESLEFSVNLVYQFVKNYFG